MQEFEYTLIPFLLILLFLLFLLFAVKILPSFLLARQFGLRRSLSAGFLLSSRLSLIIAASSIGLELGVITPGINASFVIMATVTCFLGPVLYNLIKPQNRVPQGTRKFLLPNTKITMAIAPSVTKIVPNPIMTI